MITVRTPTVSEVACYQMMRKDSPLSRLVLISRVGTLIIGVIAFLLALQAESLVHRLELYVCAGLETSFGPTLLTTLWWKKVTKQRVLSGMILGTVRVLI